MIFVFGSNEAGIHGAGAARTAYNKYGAVWGYGVGLAGQSYAIPTKDGAIRTLPRESVKKYVVQFRDFAESHPVLQFQVTRIGCGLAGFRDAEIAPLFYAAPPNCLFDSEWTSYLHPTAQFWGTF